METTDDPIDINIGLSQRGAGYAATRHLLELGHRVVGQISVPLDARAVQRFNGYSDAIADFGAEPHPISIELSSSFALGAQLFGELRDRHPNMTAVFAGNDNLALGALFECQRRGIRVPEDMSIVGFNDLDFSAVAHPSLTTVATPRYEMGNRSAEIVLEIVGGSGERPRNTRIDLGFRLIVRGSTAPPASG